MSTLQLFAICADQLQTLPVATFAQDFTDLYPGLELGVYTIFRSYEHTKFLWLDHHLLRLAQSASLLGWEYELDETALRMAIHQVSTAYPAPEMRIRIDILPAPATALGSESRELIAVMPFTPLPMEYYNKGVGLGFAEGLLRATPLIKTANFATARKAYQVGAMEMYEKLMVNSEGFMMEGISSNFYGVIAGVLHTAGSGVLEGITRKIILDLAFELGIRVRLTPVHLNQAAELQEAAISSSSRGLLPVVTINGQRVGNGQPGPICKQLLNAYNRFVAATIQPALSIY